jgi:NAD(P)-dependent dehydrogenase (short-subunit alcohol dehydrogenase family)
MNLSLEGRVAVVTGASKGIGAGIAKTLAEAGATVVVNFSTDQKGADAVVSSIVAKGGKAIAVQGNVAKADEVQHLFAVTKQEFGKLDILVNNAGVYSFAPIANLQEDEFHRQFNTNVLGSLLTIRDSLQLFGPNGGSHHQYQLGRKHWSRSEYGRLCRRQGRSGFRDKGRREAAAISRCAQSRASATICHEAESRI